MSWQGVSGFCIVREIISKLCTKLLCEDHALQCIVQLIEIIFAILDM